LKISVAYHEHVSGNLQDAEDVYQRWRVLYPRDWRPRGRQARLYLTRGEFERAVEEAREALRRGANRAPPYVTLARAYLGLGDFDEAKTVCEQIGRLRRGQDRLRTDVGRRA
jgi:Flp pilus assembly protein TadD